VELASYATIVFDCDGVLLDSNVIKSKAFWQVGIQWGEQAAKALLDYHVSNGGVSRYLKFSHFRSVILPSILGKESPATEEEMLQCYAQIAQAQLLQAKMADQLDSLREATAGSKWLVVSGGDQAEIRAVFSSRNIAEWFDGGIFGSPDKKSLILRRELNHGNIIQPAVYLGDSVYDYECAREAGLDFIFVSNWSEVKDWPEFVSQKQLPVVGKLSDFLND
jgi:HAD superfamily hydrolase (TIGR01549 family)